MSKQFEAFVNAFEALCEEHKVLLSINGRGELEVWNGQLSPTHFNCGYDDELIDKTEEE